MDQKQRKAGVKTELENTKKRNSVGTYVPKKFNKGLLLRLQHKPAKNEYARQQWA